MKFILTKELGRLAKWLRILGYDTIYYNKPDKSRFIIVSLRDKRVILTRQAKMSRFTGVRMVQIKEDFVQRQLEQVIKELGLEIDENKTFTRCVDCNELLMDVKKDKIKDKVPTYVFETQNEFKICPACTKVFWPGTHWELVKRFLEKISTDEHR